MHKFNGVAKDKKLIVGVGSALVDILICEDEDFLIKTGAAKGGMTYVAKEFIEQSLAISSRPATIVPGGSACNTVVGIGKLGGQARFVSKCGSGEMGQFFENELKRHNVEPFFFRSNSSTGRVLSIVTPDTQRSMFTFLGASAEALPQEISEQCFEGAAIVHIEGYLLFNSDLILRVLETARACGALISFDFPSYNSIAIYYELLRHIVETYVDILMANEDEALAYTGYSDENRAVGALSEKVKIAVLKAGARGSFIAHNGEVLKIHPAGIDNVIDTTGAGDLWAAGFLHGLVSGYPLEKCGQMGSVCSYEVCQVLGANIPDAGWKRIRKRLNNPFKN
jgi:sugar/nucleoside kinase (ribokinase family)